MDDRSIKELLRERSEESLQQLDQQYGRLCRRIAFNVLDDLRDVEECVNDAYLAIWNSIPPADPESLSAYLCQTVRNISINRLKREKAKKRSSQYTIAMEELSEDVPAPGGVESEVLKNELITEITDFLRTQPEGSRILFLRRYWYAESIPEIAKELEISEHLASARLSRIRKRLKKYLIKRGNVIHE